VATLPFAIEEITTRGDHGHLIVWGPLGTGDDGDPISMIGSGRRTVQIVGAFGGGSRMVIEGSNDGATYALLRDVHGNQLTFNSPGISTIQDLTRYLRPRASVGNPAATVHLLVRKTESR
jgi:hypothetical protein